MIYRILFLILSYIFILIFPSLSLAQTTITVASLPGFEGTINENEAASKYEKFSSRLFEKNREIIPTAFALINTIGYPNGRSIIRQFPHLEFGAAMGGGIYKYNRQNEYTDDNPAFPFAGVNGGFHIGTGIISSLDVTFKVFVFSFGAVYDKSGNIDGDGANTAYNMDIKDADLNSYGIKFRYNFVERRVILPLIFSFGGMTFNLAFDYMTGEMKSNFQIEDLEEISYSGVPTGLLLDVSGEPDSDFSIYSVTPEAFIYFDFFTFFSLYTGPSVSFNFGEFNFDMTAQGYILNPGNHNERIATADLTSKYKMEPKLFLPKWTVGLEFSVLALRIQVEGSTLLTSASDSFTGQAGIRFQF